MIDTPKEDSILPQRRSIRLRGYDYSRAGAYFITICTQNRACLFGDIVNGAMELNDAGRMVQRVWDETPVHYQGIEADAFAVMPNHIHGIIIIVGEDHHGYPIKPVGAGPRACPSSGGADGRPQGAAPTGVHLASTLSLSEVVRRFKTLTTKRYADGVKTSGWKPFAGKLWQRNYYDHILRDEDDLHRIREYIANNPALWQSDDHYPVNL